jgi:hypothetical protein
MEVASVADVAQRRERGERPRNLFIYQALFAAGVYFLTGQNARMTAYIFIFHFFLWKILQALALV